MNIRRLFPFALFALLLATAVRPTVDPDMWWHLRTGEAILADGIPRHDLFSFTFPQNEWVAHEWLSQVLMWAGLQAFGLEGLMVLFGVVAIVPFWLMYRISAGRPYLAGLVVAVAAKAASVVWGIRPQLFNLLLLGVFVYLLERRRRGELGRWVFWVLPGLVLLWANLHSGYLLGIVLMATYLIGEFLEGRRSEPAAATLRGRDLGSLALATAAAPVVALLNPNGYRLWFYPFETLASSVQRSFIIEWFPPKPSEVVFWLLVALIGAGLYGFLKASHRVAVTDVLLFAGTAVGGFLSVRNIPIFAIVATPILCRYLAVALRYAERTIAAPDTSALGIATLAAGAAFLTAAGLLVTGTIRDNDAAVAETFPVAAVDWLEASRLSDRAIFNAYSWGGYLIWRGHPVFVDGRADVYGDEGLLVFAETYFLEEDWREPLDRFAIEVVLVEAGSTLGVSLQNEPAWGTVYEDDVARVFLRGG